MTLKPPSPDVKIRNRVFSILYSREIKLSIVIVRFIRSIPTKDHILCI